MIRLCAHCVAEGKPGLLGEKEPLADTRVTHGICDEHSAAVLAEARALVQACRESTREASQQQGGTR